MSSIRKEQVCLNCGAEVKGRYCPDCGQENREPRESFTELVYHFLSDFTSFDSKIFITLKDLMFQPGFLTKEYLAGRRQRYLHPIRMYIFVSFIYFFVMVLLSYYNNDAALTFKNREASIEKLHAVIDTVKAEIDTTAAGDNKVGAVVLKQTNSGLRNLNSLIEVTRKYDRLSSFDASQKRLKNKNHLTGVYHFTARKIIAWKEKYGEQAQEMAWNKFLNLIPKVMFVMLPLFALYLKWFYRRDHLYTDHIIFSLHYHTFAFLLMLVVLVLGAVLHHNFLLYGIFPILFVYLLLALRNRYADNWAKTLVKTIGIGVVYSISLCLGLVAAIILTFITL